MDVWEGDGSLIYIFKALMAMAIYGETRSGEVLTHSSITFPYGFPVLFVLAVHVSASNSVVQNVM